MTWRCRGIKMSEWNMSEEDIVAVKLKDDQSLFIS